MGNGKTLADNTMIRFNTGGSCNIETEDTWRIDHCNCLEEVF